MSANKMQVPDYLVSSNPTIGRVVSISGSQAIVALDSDIGVQDAKGAQMGTLLAVETRASTAFGLVTALSIPAPAQSAGEKEILVAELELMGEVCSPEEGSPIEFRRGITKYPALGDRVCIASHSQLQQAYCNPKGTSIRIGAIQQDMSIPAMIDIDEMLGKHFAILGSTGTGKSCSVALILRGILESSPQSHVLLLDPHNEYGTSFAGSAEVIAPQNLNLPFWLFTFEEIVEVVLGGEKDRETEIEILAELIPLAKQRYAAGRSRDRAGVIQRRPVDTGSITVDTPVPYRASDLVAMLDEHLGRLDLRRERGPFKHLKARIESLSLDPRYTFMFGSLTVEDKMSEILGHLFRVPVDGKPITIIELASLPTEVVSAVVSVLCRMTFDFALWSNGAIPIHLVCEEAHRYMPQDTSLGFEPAKRALSRIAKEGRKYGVSLSVVSQRAAELDSTILSQCSTVFAMRMTNERDQEIVKAAVYDAATSLLEFLPSMGEREAIAFGEGIALPGRIRFDRLPDDALPRSNTARFSENWSHDVGDARFLENVVARWRGMAEETAQSLPSPAAPAVAQPEHPNSRPQGLQNTAVDAAAALTQMRSDPTSQRQATPSTPAPAQGPGVPPGPAATAPSYTAPSHPAAQTVPRTQREANLQRVQPSASSVQQPAPASPQPARPFADTAGLGATAASQTGANQLAHQTAGGQRQVEASPLSPRPAERQHAPARGTFGHRAPTTPTKP